MSPGRFAGLVLLATLLLQSVWIAVLPPFGGIDEIDHAYRASEVAHGEWVAGPYAAHGRGRLVTVPASLVAAASAQCSALPYMGTDNCHPVEQAPRGMVRVASSAGDYEPIFYWVVGSAGRPFSGASALYAMRVATLILVDIFVFLAAWSLAGGGSRLWRTAGLAIALTPIAVYSTSVVAPNGLEITAALACWSAILGLRDGRPERERDLLVVAGVSAVLVAGLRGLGPGFLLVILGTCVLIDPKRYWTILQRRRGLVLAAAFCTLLSLVLAEVWAFHWVGSGGPGAPWTHPAASGAAVGSRYGWVPGGLLLWPLQTIAAFPFRNQPAPIAVYALFTPLFLGLLVFGLRRAASRTRRILLALVLGVLLLPFAATALSYSQVGGVIWQGRYGLPAAVGVPLLASLALGRVRPAHPRWSVIGGAVLLAVIHGLGVVHVLSMEEHRRVSTHDPAWHPPYAVVVWLVVALAWVLMARAAIREPTERKAQAAELMPSNDTGANGLPQSRPRENADSRSCWE